jgi:hypothetical protein
VKEAHVSRALLFLVGCGLIVFGVFQQCPWLAYVIGGVLVCGLASLLERSAMRNESTAKPEAKS